MKTNSKNKKSSYNKSVKQTKNIPNPPNPLNQQIEIALNRNLRRFNIKKRTSEIDQLVIRYNLI